MACPCGRGIRADRVAGRSVRRAVEVALASRGRSLASWCENWSLRTGQSPTPVCRAARLLLLRLDRGEGPDGETEVWIAWSLDATLPGVIPADLLPPIVTSPYAHAHSRNYRVVEGGRAA